MDGFEGGVCERPDECILAHVGIAFAFCDDAGDSGVKGVVFVESDFESPLVAIDLCDVEVAGGDSGGHDFDGGFDFFWHFAISVFEVGGDFAEGEGVSGGHELLVEVEPLGGVFDIAFGDECLHREIDGGEWF